MSVRGIDDAVGRAFDGYDLDKSGQIDVAEFGKLCASLGTELKDYELERALSLLDEDRSGQISKAEFTNWWLNRGEDLDGDGIISETEKKLSRVAHSGFEKAISFHLDSLHEDRLSINREVVSLEERKAAIQKKLDTFTTELAAKNKIIAQLQDEKAKCDQVISEVEGAFLSIMEASQSLLHTTKSLSTRLDGKFPAREISNDDTLLSIQKAQAMRMMEAPPSYTMETSSDHRLYEGAPGPSLPAPSSSFTPEVRALHEAGFVPPPSRGK